VRENDPVSTFPRTDKKTLGYSIEQVEAFLAEARTAYDANEGSEQLSAESIRHTAFVMAKGGYSPSHVDAAMERLEDAFAARERERAARSKGKKALTAEARAKAQEIIDRLGRPAGHRFARTSFLTVGYSVADVDRLANRLVKHFEGGRALTPDDVRTAVFRPQRGGYREGQVDIVLDGVVDVMLAVR
jgi:DivIVA domain-containing protein